MKDFYVTFVFCAAPMWQLSRLQNFLFSCLGFVLFFHTKKNQNNTFLCSSALKIWIKLMCFIQFQFSKNFVLYK